ncbi:DREB protein, partial [Amia calva]|nr:DREB protein [Amia calva]
LFCYSNLCPPSPSVSTPAGGVAELAAKFHVGRPLYGLCQVTAPGSGQPRIVMINWVGEEVQEPRRSECASHVPAIKAFFKEAHVFVSAQKPDDVTEESIGSVVSKIAPPSERARRMSCPVDTKEAVGTNYRKTNAAMEMRRINRDSFWARAEREEELRKEEERRRVLEERRRWEKERVMQERREAEERERRLSEKEQLLQEQRMMQAKMEAEARKQEKAKWEVQQQQHEEEMRARFRRSESIEKAAEAAVLVSQRSMNPREFFRQLSSSSSRTPPSPGSPRTAPALPSDTPVAPLASPAAPMTPPSPAPPLGTSEAAEEEEEELKEEEEEEEEEEKRACVPVHIEAPAESVCLQAMETDSVVQAACRKLCVRALYEYQAEDESELSLEPGDIISAVETVNQAWLSGCSKDGRQGMFPANYVEAL